MFCCESIVFVNARYALLQLRVNSVGWPMNFNRTMKWMISVKEERERATRKKPAAPLTFRYTPNCRGVPFQW